MFLLHLFTPKHYMNLLHPFTSSCVYFAPSHPHIFPSHLHTHIFSFHPFIPPHPHTPPSTPVRCTCSAVFQSAIAQPWKLHTASGSVRVRPANAAAPANWAGNERKRDPRGGESPQIGSSDKEGRAHQEEVKKTLGFALLLDKNKQ
jgi:hypothetical protein